MITWCIKSLQTKVDISRFCKTRMFTIYLQDQKLRNENFYKIILYARRRSAISVPETMNSLLIWTYLMMIVTSSVLHPPQKFARPPCLTSLSLFTKQQYEEVVNWRKFTKLRDDSEIRFEVASVRRTRICGVRGREVQNITGGMRTSHNEEVHNFYSSPSLLRVIKTRRTRM